MLESGTDAMTEKPISWPVQKIGQRVQGASRAFPSQVLKYGFRTSNGNTGGVRVDAWTTVAAAARYVVPRILSCGDWESTPPESRKSQVDVGTSGSICSCYEVSRYAMFSIV